jgi:CheY-like chemotaxis protein
MDTMLGRLIGDDIQLKSILQGDLGTIKADPGQLEQVLMNLVINARDAMPKGGKIVLTTSNVEIEKTCDRRHSPVKPGQYVSLTVSDTGLGMDLETQSHIFEPFFSTKAAGRGTGLGLSTVFGIVKQSEGSIAVCGQTGKGTTFTIHFPRCEQAPTVVLPPKAKAPHGGTETTLLVDDASSLRELTRLVLERCGYTVIDSGDPGESLRIAADHLGPLPLKITDVVMPGISGSVLAERLSAIRPETKVLYISGYADDETVLSNVPRQDHAFLQKPFSRDALVRKVRQLLDSTSRPAPKIEESRPSGK